MIEAKPDIWLPKVVLRELKNNSQKKTPDNTEGHNISSWISLKMKKITEVKNFQPNNWNTEDHRKYPTLWRGYPVAGSLFLNSNLNSAKRIKWINFKAQIYTPKIKSLLKYSIDKIILWALKFQLKLSGKNETAVKCKHDTAHQLSVLLMLVGNTHEKCISYSREPKGPVTQGQWTTSQHRSNDDLTD